MKVEVRLGEPLWRQVGNKSIELELEEHATVGILVERLLEMHPSLDEYLANQETPLTVFLDDALVEQETVLQDGDRPMLIWAITGG
jgi:molybdopterin converting factor small subunit